MKKLFLSLIYGGLILSVISCKDQIGANSISSDEAAEIVAMSLSDDSMGATSFIYTAVDASNNAQSNGMMKVKATNIVSKDTSINYSSNPSALVSYTLTANFSYNFDLNLSNKVTSSTVTYSYNGNFDAPRLSSTHSGSGNLSLNSLDTDICTVDGLFKRTSDVETKGVKAKQTNSETTVTFSSIEVNKLTETILSGSATININGSLSGKGDFEFNGTIVFEGDGMATLTFSDKSYSINLKTGDYTAI